MADEKDILKEFLTGGWIVAALGGLGMLARNLIDGVQRSHWEHFKRILAAAICSTIAWFILEQVEVGSLTKAISYGVVGVVSPEILQGLTALAKKFAKKPQDLINKK
jgi:ABC-type thiamin/hydroxymethylpyrimidine transport system permease subunit